MKNIMTDTTLITQLRQRSRQVQSDLLKSSCLDNFVNDIRESAELAADGGYFKTNIEIPSELGALDSHTLANELCRRMNLPVECSTAIFNFAKINDFVYLVFNWA